MVPPWASVESFSPQLPPMATNPSRTLPGFKYSGREGEGVNWSTLPPYYTEWGFLLFCG